ncbi:MAG: Crossover junction endodeoxyribonuclease RuvC [Firmicutes bacterium ADurb.Bin419]|nr:MAG: Crossover junction endodeoxyribonuclease RuvC [Firmicutes bacterium ADurb.Bin419]
MYDMFFGIDPGTTNAAYALYNGFCTFAFDYKEKNLYKYIEQFMHTVLNIIDDYNASLVVIERQFDKSKEKKLEQFVSIIRYELSVNDIHYMLIAPTQLKLYLTGSGSADESTYWTAYQKACDKKEIHGDKFTPVHDSYNQHVKEAQLLGMIGYAKHNLDNKLKDDYPKYIKELLNRLVVQ